MLKKVMAVAALAGAAALTATPAAADVCVTVHLEVNETVVDQAQCVPV